MTYPRPSASGCASISPTPNWREQVTAGVEGRPPNISPPRAGACFGAFTGSTAAPLPHCFRGAPAPRPEQLLGAGGAKSRPRRTHRRRPGGRGGIGSVLTEVAEGEIDIEGAPCTFRGSGTALGPGTSAYVETPARGTDRPSNGRHAPSSLQPGRLHVTAQDQSAAGWPGSADRPATNVRGRLRTPESRKGSGGL